MAGGGPLNGNHELRKFTLRIHMFNVYEDEMRIPTSFYILWKNELKSGNSYVKDPRNKIHCLEVQKRGKYGYFSYGLSAMAEYYKFDIVTYVNFCYLGDQLFNIKIFGDDGKEFEYPMLEQPHDDHVPGYDVQYESDSPPIAEVQADDDDEEQLTDKMWTVVLTEAAASGRNPLPIPAKFVREFMMDFKGEVNLLNDGKIDHCKFMRSGRSRRECYLGLGWYNFCTVKRLKKGDRLIFDLIIGSQDFDVKIIRK